MNLVFLLLEVYIQPVGFAPNYLAPPSQPQQQRSHDPPHTILHTAHHGTQVRALSEELVLLVADFCPGWPEGWS